MPDKEPNLMTEPTTALLYMARDFQTRYGVPCRVSCQVDTAGVIRMKVEAWRVDEWVEQKDAFEDPGPQVHNRR